MDDVIDSLDSEQPSCAFITANKMSFQVKDFLDMPHCMLVHLQVSKGGHVCSFSHFSFNDNRTVPKDRKVSLCRLQTQQSE